MIPRTWRVRFRVFRPRQPAVGLMGLGYAMAAKDIAVKKYVVKLDEAERNCLQSLINKGKSPAQRLLSAMASSCCPMLRSMVPACGVHFIPPNA